MRIGLISDTHGRWSPCLPDVFQGVSLILHAGDVGSPEVLQRLECIAPAYAVRGNCDHGPQLAALPRSRTVDAQKLRIGLVHGDLLDQSDLARAAWEHFAGSDVKIVVHGHTHQPSQCVIDGVLIVNPGAVFQYSSDMRRTVAILDVSEPNEPKVEIVALPSAKSL